MNPNTLRPHACAPTKDLAADIPLGRSRAVAQVDRSALAGTVKVLPSLD